VHLDLDLHYNGHPKFDNESDNGLGISGKIRSF